MKKQSILFLALLAAASCQKENTQDIAPVFESNVELRASFDEQSSRIVTEDGLTFSLEEGKERIGVYINLGDTPIYDNVLYTAGSADEQGWISFSTDVPVHVQSNSKFFAYAPYSATTVDVSGSTDDGASEPSAAGSDWNGKRAINLPDLQEQPAAGVKTDIAKYYSVVAVPATPVARDVLDSYSVNLQFSGVFALVRFGLNNFTEGVIKVSKLVFSAENAALTGYFSVDLTHENPKLSNSEYAPEAIAGKTFDKVTVTLAEPATIAAQEMAEVYAVVNACAVNNPKLTVYATDAEGKDIVFEKTLKAKTFSRQQRTAIGVKLENPIYEEAGPVICNGESYETIADAVAANADATEITLKAGTFTLPDDLKNLTFTGDEGAVINIENVDVYRYSDVVFNNITFNAGQEIYHGFKHAETITFNKCTINGLLFGYGSHEIYNECIFNNPNGYSMWTYGANADYTGCVFNGNGKFLHVYNEGNVDLRTINIKDCKFVSTAKNKAAVSVKSSCGDTHLQFNVNIDNCTTEGEFPEENNGLWSCDNKFFDTVSIKVDGTEVYKKDLGYKEVDGGYEIYSAKGLQWLAEEVNGGNNFSGKTITLTADIDLDGIDWTPIGTGNTLLGVFDGGEHTISNIKVVGTDVAGLFGSARNVKNLTVKNVDIQGNFKAAALVADGLCSRIENCHVDGGTVVSTPRQNNSGKMDDGNNVGGICGYLSAEPQAYIKNCSVKNLTITAYRDLGGLVGTATNSAYEISGNTIENVTVTCDQTVENYDGAPKTPNAGEIVGRNLNSKIDVTSNNTHTNVTVEILGGGNETIAEGIELTPDGTYNIVSAAGVKSLADLVNAGDNFEGKTIVLTADANLGGEEWMPIGNGTRSGQTYTGNAFKGTFDGNGKTISGLKITERSGKAAAGLFGVLDGGTVKDVTLEVDIDVASKSNELAAGCVGLLTNNGLVENVTVSGSVKSGETAAGIVSRVIKSGTVRNCHNHATISGTAHNAGGIVGAAYYDNEGMTIEGCTNDGAVSGTTAVGGIAGLSAAEVKNCSNSATITGNGTSVGGVIGEQQNAGSVTGCTNTGNVTNKTAAYGNGGIVGWIRYSGGTADYPNKSIITVSGCENRGTVSGGNDAGGIVGMVYHYGRIYDNKNYAPTLSAKTFVAGVVGTAQFTEAHPGMTDEEHVYVTNNYSETTLDNMTGGLKAKFVYINNSDKTTDSGNTPDDGIQVSTAEEAIAAIEGGGKVTVAGAIDKIDFTTLNPTAPVELVLNAKVGEIVLGSSASNPAQTTITVAKDVDYPTFSVVQGKDIQNLTIIGDPTSSKACTSGISIHDGPINKITTVKNITIKGVRFSGKGINCAFTADPQTTQNIVIEDCEGIDMVEPLFQTSNNKYVNTHVGDITIRNNKATFSASAANSVNALYICFTTTGTVLIENNTFINPPKHGIMADSNACENFIVRGNTFTNPVEDGVKIDYPINNVVIENNTITPTEYGIRIARFKSDYNPTVTISGNSIDMSKAKNTFNGISIAPNEANGQAKLVIKENVKVAGNVTEWFSINSALVLNEGSDVATPFNN